MRDLTEVAPPGWGHTKAEKEKTKPDKPKSKIGGTIAAMKRAQDRGDIDKNLNIFALAYSMKNKGAKPHYKPGTKEKYKKYQEEEKQITPMQDNNLFGNAYAGTKSSKKKKVKKEEVKASYSQGQVTFGSFYNRAKEAMKDAAKKKEKDRESKKRNEKVRADTHKHGMKFYDKKGSGRIKDGKKVYD